MCSLPRLELNWSKQKTNFKACSLDLYKNERKGPHWYQITLQTERLAVGWKETAKEETYLVNKGVICSAHFVPPTHNGELAKQLRSITEYEAEDWIKFKIIETWGRTLKGEVQQSNRISTKGCNDTRYLLCKDGPGQGENCRRSNVEYQFKCQMCPPNNKAVYLGETSQNLFTHAIEHDTD